nr:nuclear transport factor 2 family protein [Agrobacterium tumefaciens]
MKSSLLTAVLLAAVGSSANADSTSPTTESNGLPSFPVRKPVTSAAFAQNLNDIEAIRTALGLYLEGGRQGKSAVMKPAFHPQAVMYGDPTGTVEGGPVSRLFDDIDGNPAAPDLKAEIVSVEVQGSVAYARVESDNWGGARYSDMFLLVKNDGQWKILTKAFHQYR